MLDTGLMSVMFIVLALLFNLFTAYFPFSTSAVVAIWFLATTGIAGYRIEVPPTALVWIITICYVGIAMCLDITDLKEKWKTLRLW